jgi:L-2,4-diaminobutyric acid acetyltransferase
MPGEPTATATCTGPRGQTAAPIRLGRPRPGEGRKLWRLARDCRKLDLNSPYCYLLWCRDFARTSVVARAGEAVVGFLTGYVRPDAPDTLFVWQIAVDGAYRGQRIARRMLDHLGLVMTELGCRHMEATVTPDNVASLRTFESFARAQGAALRRREGFGSALFPDHHEPEVLIRIGPLPQRPAPGGTTAPEQK